MNSRDLTDEFFLIASNDIFWLESYAREADHDSEFYPFVTSNSYPGGLFQNPDRLACIRPTEMFWRSGESGANPAFYSSSTYIDNLLQRLQANAKWMRTTAAGFNRLTEYANGDLYNMTTNLIGFNAIEPAGQTVNYIGCKPTGYMGVRLMLKNGQANYLAFGPHLEPDFGGADFDLMLDWLIMHEFTHIFHYNEAPNKN